MSSLVNKVRWSDLLARKIGRLNILPRKIRSVIIRFLAGNQCQKLGRSFEVSLFGKKYRGATDSHIDWHVFFFGDYDPIGTRFLREVASKIDPVFIDVGANTGTHTLAISECCQKIHCFEPFPDVLKSLRENLNCNSIENVEVHAVGLSDTSRTAGFLTDKSGNLGAGTFQYSHDQEPDLHLPVKKADAFFPTVGISDFQLMKIDVEGHEIAVLTGMSQCLESSRPIILWEFNPDRNNCPSVEDLLNLFPKEYEIFRLGFEERWTRSTPELQNLNSLGRGNLVSVPSEKIEIVKHLIQNNA